MHLVSERVVRLSDVEEGSLVHLHDLHVDAQARLQLRGLGLTDAALLRVCKQGEPCIVLVRTTRIGISGSIAQQVFVRMADEREVAWR